MNYQRLFDHMQAEHGLTLLESEMQEIVNVVREMRGGAAKEGADSRSAFSIHDLKCGNILNYDTAEGEILPTVIDWQDLKRLAEDPKGFNLVHSPIPLTQDYLRLFGAIENQNYWLIGAIELAWITTDEHFEMEWQTPYHSWKIKPFKYVHELQNFYHCLTGVMLSLS